MLQNSSSVSLGSDLRQAYIEISTGPGEFDTSKITFKAYDLDW